MNTIEIKRLMSKGISIKPIIAHLKTSKNLAKLLSFGFGFVLICWLLSQIEISSAIQTIREAPFHKILLGFLCYGASFYFRAVRFRLLLPSDKRINLLFPIVLVHYSALNIIPARLGELSYVYLLKKVNDISTGRSVSSLLLARIFDQIAISMMFLFSLCFINFTIQWLKTLSLCIGGLLIASTVILILILTYKEQCSHTLRRLIRRLKWEDNKIIQRVLHEVEEMNTGFKSIESRTMAGKVLGLSLLIWFNMFGVNYMLLTAFGINLSYLEIVLAKTFIILITIIPIDIVNGIGVRQTTWTFIALAMGVPTKNAAIVANFGTRIVATIYLFLFGIYGVWRLRELRKRVS